MNNLKKIGLSALAGSLAVTSASAFDYTVSGTATMAYSSVDAPAFAPSTTGKGIGLATDLTLAGNGELDNGYTVDWFMVLDTDAAVSNTSGTLALGMGSLGTLQFNNHNGSKANGIDDVMPAAYNETWDGLTSADNDPSFFGGATASGSIDYRAPSLDLAGITANLALTYDPAADEGAATKGGQNTSNVSGNAVVLELAHDSGVSLGFGRETIDNSSVAAGGTDEESLTGYIKYAMGPVSVGYQEAQQDTANGGQDLSSQLWGIAYTAGNVSVSYGESEYTTEAVGAATAEVVSELDSIQVAYTMGAMTISAAMSETGNAGNVAGQTHEENEIAVTFAF
jgi:outer membrane protein OmpU